MIFNLSNTPMARSHLGKPPNEGELSAITFDLLCVADRAFSDLGDEALSLNEANIGAVADSIERIPILFREFGDADSLRRRLSELIGMTLSAGDVPWGDMALPAECE